MTGGRSSSGGAALRADLGIVLEVFAFTDREGAPMVSVRARDVFGTPLGDERADHVSAVLVAAGNAIGARRAREASEPRAAELGGVPAHVDGEGDGGES